jgi:wyosine [tRNA(Phe)-imidazoG37] synthetase (radical SAM superfamily)
MNGKADCPSATFAGNGEPTSHPHFPEIIDDTIRLRKRYSPQSKISVLSNAHVSSAARVSARHCSRLTTTF